ncbi:uncharacterized protein EV420DRAFT_1484239 [Desarmillaria tabescens]|uniref:Uncharacterized protein n=1 Tax=Armillaria tabescens TaxID=1929756 RepID=A0AA39MT25_ARMTA|nr:uncharacterized protein EV420DRAFT_1484239 [Desarmillaria tabescens]KAK0445592.1 hypothetical protein EV420DRAFT_1484239 [Desarmillaria tabescens]
MFSTVTFFTLLTALSGVTALPFSDLVRSLPRDITHIAVDEGKRYPVDDASSSSVERRAASQCAQLSVDEAKTLSGWDAIVQYANDNWGSGSRNIVTNPSDYVDSPAQVCITDDVVQLSFSGDPVCQTHTASSQGTLVGTEGEVDIEVDQGFNTDTSYTMSTASTIGVSDTLTVKIGVPEVAEVTEALTISASVTDTTSSTFDVSYNDVSKVTIKMTAPEGKTCNAQTSTKTCNIQATGNIRYLATGWIWFNYNDKTQGHYKWAANIDSILTNQDDRSSFATFKGSMVANTYTSYAGNCQ